MKPPWHFILGWAVSHFKRGCFAKSIGVFCQISQGGGFGPYIKMIFQDIQTYFLCQVFFLTSIP